MSNFNPNYPQQQLNDGLCSIEMLKSLVENPPQVASSMFQFINYQHKALADYQFMVKYLQEVYNPPDNNLQLSKQRQQDLHLMRPPDSSQVKKVPIDKTAKPMIDPKKPPEKFPQPLVFPKGYGIYASAFHPVFQNPKALFVSPFETAPPAKTHVEVNQGINAKRKPQNPAAAPLYEYPKKKLKGTGQEKSSVPKNAKIIELDDDDDDEAEILPKQPVQNRTKKANNVNKLTAIRPLYRTGEKKTQPYKAPIEIIDSPELISKEQFIIEEEKDGATTNATNFDDFNDNTKDGESKDEGGVLDIFDLNIDDLGIKILGEVFLCDKCQREIPQKDVDKGFKETCASCSKKLKTSKSVVGNKKNNRGSAAHKEESLKYEQENSILEDNNTSSKEDETASKYDILAPIHQPRGFYEETANLNIMNSDQNLRPTALGKMHQTAIIPLNIYAKGKKKKMKKLWNPEKLEHSACKSMISLVFPNMVDEKFRNDVNGKNSVYLLDEEITEILVRFKYNIEQALSWSMKSNPEFQYYVKKSANRRRIMTRGTGRGYSNIYE